MNHQRRRPPIFDRGFQFGRRSAHHCFRGERYHLTFECAQSSDIGKEVVEDDNKVTSDLDEVGSR